MTFVYVLPGVIIGHQLVWGLLKHLRSEGQTFKRYQIAGFVALEVALGVFVWRSGSLSLLVWVAANVVMLAVMRRRSINNG